MSSAFVLCNLLQKWVCYACPKFWKFLPECTVRGPVPGRNCLLLCAGVPVTSQALIGWPPRSNEIRTSPLPTRAGSVLFHPLFYSILFSSSIPLLLFCSILSSFVLGSILSSLLFSLQFVLFVLLGSCSLALTLLLLLFVLLFSSPLFSLLVFFETLLSSSSWIVLRAVFRSLLLVHEFSFVYRRVGGRRILELRRASSNLRVYSGSLSSEAPHFFH